MKLTFLKLFYILFLKEFLACNGCFWFLPELKRGLGLAFGAHFLHDFSIKMFLIYNTFILPQFQCHNFLPSQDVKQNVLLRSYLDN